MRCDLNSIPFVWKAVVVFVLAVLSLELLREQSLEGGNGSRWERDPSEQELQLTWQGAIEGWKDLPAPMDAEVALDHGLLQPGVNPQPTRTYYLCPESERKGAGPATMGAVDQMLPALPAAVTSGRVVFALTSWNPGGRQLPSEENAARYLQLGAELRNEAGAMRIWRSFGFDLKGYRENGYALAFSAGEAARAREQILAIARRYSQGAIYEFWPLAGDPYRMTRVTVPAVMGQQVAGQATMVVCSPPKSPFADPGMLFPSDA